MKGTCSIKLAVVCELAELSMELQRLRVECKMFIDSLSERNKSKNAIKGFQSCIKLSLFKGNHSLFKKTLSDFITIGECFHSIFKLYVFKGNYSLVKITPLLLKLLPLNEIAIQYFQRFTCP